MSNPGDNLTSTSGSTGDILTSREHDRRLHHARIAATDQLQTDGTGMFNAIEAAIAVATRVEITDDTLDVMAEVSGTRVLPGMDALHDIARALAEHWGLEVRDA